MEGWKEALRWSLWQGGEEHEVYKDYWGFGSAECEYGWEYVAICM